MSLDYLVGSTDVLLEKSILNRVLDIQKLKDNDKQHVFALLDAFIKQTKLERVLCDIEVNANMLKEVLQLQSLDEDDKNSALKLLTSFLRDTKTKHAYTK